MKKNVDFNGKHPTNLTSSISDPTRFISDYVYVHWFSVLPHTVRLPRPLHDHDVVTSGSFAPSDRSSRFWPLPVFMCVWLCVCVCVQAKRKKMSAKWKQILKNHISPCELSRHLLFISDSCEHSYVKTVEVVYFSGNVKHSQSKNERKNRQAYRTTVRTLSG